jgi:hypothetical protein
MRIISFLSCWRPFGRRFQRYGEQEARAIRQQKNLLAFDQNLASLRKPMVSRSEQQDCEARFLEQPRRQPTAVPNK